MSGWCWERDLIHVGSWERSVCSSSFNRDDASFEHGIVCLKSIDFVHQREAGALKAPDVVVETFVGEHEAHEGLEFLRNGRGNCES